MAIPGFTTPFRYPAISESISARTGPVGKITVRFDRAGVAYVFCNLHPQMAAVVVTVESPYFGVSDKAGHISIRNVPPGAYVLHVWYENAASQTLKTLHRAIVIGDDHSCMSTVSNQIGKGGSRLLAKICDLTDCLPRKTRVHITV
jgi:hypothetical protein